MVNQTPTRTALVKRIAGREYAVVIEGDHLKIHELRLDNVLTVLAADDVARIKYTAGNETWLMDLVPFATKGDRE